MKAVRIGFAAAIVVSALVVMTATRSAVAQQASELVGAWSLVSSVNERDGRSTDQFGTGAKGMMILDAAGHFMLTIVGPDLPKFASNNRATGTADENHAVVAKSVALFGTYALQRADKAIVLRIEKSTFPNWDATEQRRLIVNLTRDELKYVTPQASGGGVGTVTWKRVAAE